MYSESVREVTIGEWEIYTDEYDCEYMKCSVCGGEFYPVDEDTVDTTPNYCQNCGAEMIKD
jgi:DNA-directed RNA polymerase subunit RPC12/RpoP